jgi:hypothetical protein
MLNIKPHFNSPLRNEIIKDTISVDGANVRKLRQRNYSAGYEKGKSVGV